MALAHYEVTMGTSGWKKRPPWEEGPWTSGTEGTRDAPFGEREKRGSGIFAPTLTLAHTHQGRWVMMGRAKTDARHCLYTLP